MRILGKEIFYNVLVTKAIETVTKIPNRNGFIDKSQKDSDKTKKTDWKFW